MFESEKALTVKHDGLFYPNFGSNMDKPKSLVVFFFIIFLTKRLGLPIFDPKFG